MNNSQINETMSWFFEKTNKIDKHLTRPNMKIREKTKKQNRDENENITADPQKYKTLL